MSDKAFIDTNIFVYAYDRSGPVKSGRARNLIFDAYRSGNAVISTQALAEFFQVYTVKYCVP